jgi:hypothetical protein
VRAVREYEQADSTQVRELEVVRVDGKKKTGRPIKLTPARFKRMLDLIREGHTVNAACQIEGVSYVNWRFHVRENPEWQAAATEAEKVRDEVWRDHALEMVKSAMPRNWVAAMTYLERKYPAEFSLRNIVRTEPGEAGHYRGLSREQVLALIESSQRVDTETPKGLGLLAQSEGKSNTSFESLES